MRTLGRSFAELPARDRAAALLDAGTFRELLGPFERLRSPYLAEQGVPAQSDDGVVVARGTIERTEALVIATDGRFLGGSIGEVSGAKIAGALELALEQHRRGADIRVAIAFDSGGIRVQEANLAILALAEIHDALVALRTYTTTVGVIAGTVGVYGGMAIAAALCGRLIVTEGARIGLNGPEVIEIEAGLGEIDARDRPLVWRTTGGARRVDQCDADRLAPDDVVAVSAALRQLFACGPKAIVLPSVNVDPALDVETFAAALRARG